MKKITIQLTYIREEDEIRRRLSPRKVLESGKFPYSVKLPDAGKLFSIEDGADGAVICPEAKVELRLNGEKVHGKKALSAGDKIQAGGYLMDFHYKHEARGLSFSSKALSMGAKIGVGIFIAFELVIMLGLSQVLCKNGLFTGSAERQRISYHLIKIQKRLDTIKVNDPLEVSLMALLREDISRRMNYMSGYGDMLSPRQRKNMDADLRRIDTLLDEVSNEGQILPAEKIKFEDAVKDIIQGSKANIPK